MATKTKALPEEETFEVMEAEEAPKPPKATRVSPSGRTRVEVEMDEEGAYTITATRDGRTVHNFSDTYEDPGVDGPPRTKTP